MLVFQGRKKGEWERRGGDGENEAEKERKGGMG